MWAVDRMKRLGATGLGRFRATVLGGLVGVRVGVAKALEWAWQIRVRMGVANCVRVGVENLEPQFWPYCGAAVLAVLWAPPQA